VRSAELGDDDVESREAVVYRALLRQGVRDELGRVPLDEVAPGAIRRFAATLTERGVQLKRPLTFVRTVLKAAVEANAIESVAPMPKLWKEGRKLPDAPTPEEVAAMLTHSTGWLRVAVALAAYAGLRCGEVRALEVQDVDLAANVLRVRRAFSENEVLTPKSGHERIVPIAAELRGILVEAVRAKLPRARVVLNERGHTRTRQAVVTALKRVQQRYELRARSFHSLRHSFCSALVRGGASVEAVRLLAGHSDLATTQRYVHASAGDLTLAIAKLGVTSR